MTATKKSAAQAPSRKPALRPGDKVQWETSQGTTTGTVRKTLTAPTQIKGHHVAASPEHPEVLVESERSGKPAAHRPESLKKLR